MTTAKINALILLAPLLLILTGSGAPDIGNTVLFAIIMFSFPIVLGVAAQRQKGRTGAAWFLMSLVLAFVIHIIAGMGGGDSSHVLAAVFMFAIAPMAVIIWSLP